MLEQYVRKYYALNNNCAETMIKAANEAYNLQITDNDFHMLAGFGGGMYVGDVCGALIGAVAVISMKYCQTVAHETADLREKVMAMVRNFQNEMGGRMCKDVKPKWHSPDEHCLPTILKAAQVLESTLKDFE